MEADFVQGPISYAVHRDELYDIRIELPETMLQSAPKRRTEFLAGRLCAAHGLLTLGFPPEVHRIGRLPVWPDGIAGSISHNDHCTIAAVSKDFSGVGADIENILTNSQIEAISDRVMAPHEEKLKPPSMELRAFATLVFSAKEAVFKAAFPKIRKISEFSESHIVNVRHDQIDILYESTLFTCYWDLREKTIRALAVIT